MLLADVNVLVYAHREAAPEHAAYHKWLESVLASDEAFSMAETVVSSFLRVVTHPQAFDPPSTMDEALAFANFILGRPRCVRVRPGPDHWDIFARLCRSGGVKGNLVPDAYLAALAIEHGCELVTADRGFARFPGLRWRHPLDRRP